MKKIISLIVVLLAGSIGMYGFFLWVSEQEAKCKASFELREARNKAEETLVNAVLDTARKELPDYEIGKFTGLLRNGSHWGAPKVSRETIINEIGTACKKAELYRRYKGEGRTVPTDDDFYSVQTPGSRAAQKALDILSEFFLLEGEFGEGRKSIEEMEADLACLRQEMAKFLKN